MKKNTIRKDIKEPKGITLVALVITIIILIILAGISISIVLGDNGLIAKASKGVQAYNEEAIKEQGELGKINSFIDGLGTESTTTTNPTTEPYKNPYIPTGFTHTEGTWNNGYTIKNNTTNDEFVWVPCTLTATSETVAFARVLPTTPMTSSNYSNDPNYVYNKYELRNFRDASGSKANEIKTSVGTYGGFYIAKYEASKSNDTENAIPRSLPNVVPWKNIYKSTAIAKAEAMLPETIDGVKSALISGECWDTTLKWMVKTGNTGYDTDSTNKGWYSNNKNNNSTNLTGKSVNTTGTTTPNKINNIWDMAGNVCEWTTEECDANVNGYSVYRGGDFSRSGAEHPAALRNYGDGEHNDFVYNTIGFRVVLYK